MRTHRVHAIALPAYRHANAPVWFKPFVVRSQQSVHHNRLALHLLRIFFSPLFNATATNAFRAPSCSISRNGRFSADDRYRIYAIAGCAARLTGSRNGIKICYENDAAANDVTIVENFSHRPTHAFSDLRAIRTGPDREGRDAFLLSRNRRRFVLRPETIRQRRQVVNGRGNANQ